VNGGYSFCTSLQTATKFWVNPRHQVRKNKVWESSALHTHTTFGITVSTLCSERLQCKSQILCAGLLLVHVLQSRCVVTVRLQTCIWDVRVSIRCRYWPCWLFCGFAVQCWYSIPHTTTDCPFPCLITFHVHLPNSFPSKQLMYLKHRCRITSESSKRSFLVFGLFPFCKMKNTVCLYHVSFCICVTV